MNLNMNVLSLSRLTPSTNYYPESPNIYYVSLSSSYTIETTVTCSESTASEWVQQIMEQYGSRPTTVVGLAVGCMPQSNKVATLHLCIEPSCLILQMLHLDGIPDSVQKFLNNLKFIFIGVELDDDLNKLFESYGLGCTRFKDLGSQASFHYRDIFNQPRPGLQELAGVLCGWWLEEPEQAVLFGNWGVLNLSKDQVEYASTIAFVNFKIGKRLRYFISASS